MARYDTDGIQDVVARFPIQMGFFIDKELALKNARMSSKQSYIILPGAPAWCGGGRSILIPQVLWAVYAFTGIVVQNSDTRRMGSKSHLLCFPLNRFRQTQIIGGSLPASKETGYHRDHFRDRRMQWLTRVTQGHMRGFDLGNCYFKLGGLVIVGTDACVDSPS